MFNHNYYRKIFTLRFHFAKITKEPYKPRVLNKIKGKNGQEIVLPWHSNQEYLNTNFLWFVKEVVYSEEDLTTELKTYCPRPELKGYMFLEIYYKDELQPEYFAFTFFPEIISFLTISINKRNFETFKKIIKLKLEEYLREEIILPLTFLDFFKILRDFGHLIQMYLGSDDKFLESIRFQKNMNKFIKSIFEIKEKSDEVLIRYLFFPFAVFLELLKNDKKFLQCTQCGQIMKYAGNKKFCSLKIDGKDCGKKARNKRTYLKSKLKIVNK